MGRKSDGKVRSCRYVCANEDHRLEDKRNHLTKCPIAETRTDCQVRMGVVMDLAKGTYKVADILHSSVATNLAPDGVLKKNFRGSFNLSYTLCDHKNYLWGKRCLKHAYVFSKQNC
ncbi:hypothetical protein SEVIR_1G372350v4 [Setaria viridis]